ncbi:hypothetical protein DKY63_05790 [Pseudomonas putida]|uniref:Uncharacterized protein n=1 Tax=Pseudomonas putida TaxID=303 RepID=A0A2Z4REZ9_PSEPU|nr:hypothetical protein [Pseudomonas putida]AWY39439.1 hypothetical protein DKY63_05790 [Pseudomonas putida]
MNHTTPEELLLQILSTCLLINTQGKWHAFFDLAGHVGQVDVRVVPSNTNYHARKPGDTARQQATFTSTDQYPSEHLTEEHFRQALVDLLAWTQGYINMGNEE